MSNNNDKEFFVGYLPMPRGLKRFYLGVVAVLLIVIIGVALWLSYAQQSAGQATWDPFKKVSFEGVLSLEPYPVLHTAERSILLVQLGKFSAAPPAQNFAGQRVRATGFAIQRGDWLMLEISGDSAIEAIAGEAKTATPAPKSLGSISVRGEIVDSKCFLGVMKPGAGKVHRACARLCLKGGIPPVLVVRGQDGTSQGYLVTLADGSSASETLADLAAIPVELSGALEQRDDLLYLRMDKQGPRQLSSLELEAYGETLAANLNRELSYCVQ